MGQNFKFSKHNGNHFPFQLKLSYLDCVSQKPACDFLNVQAVVLNIFKCIHELPVNEI